MSPQYEQLITHFESKGFPIVHRNNSAGRFEIQLNTAIGIVPLDFECLGPNKWLCTAILPIPVPEEKRSEASLFLAHVNYQRPDAGLGMSPRGTVSASHMFDLPNSQLDERCLIESINLALDKLLWVKQEFFTILFGDVDAANAYAALINRLKRRADASEEQSMAA